MPEPLRVFYDGACPRCRRLARRYSSLDTSSRLEWRDLNACGPELSAAGIDSDTALKRLHVIDEAGRVHGGGAALAMIWEALPRRRRLARLARLPGASFIIERIYAFVARRRVRSSGSGPS